MTEVQEATAGVARRRVLSAPSELIGWSPRMKQGFSATIHVCTPVRSAQGGFRIIRSVSRVIVSCPGGAYWNSCSSGAFENLKNPLPPFEFLWQGLDPG